MSFTRIRKSIVFCVLMGLFCSTFAVADREPSRTVVFTAIAPYGYFIDQIGGEFISVETLVGVGKDPHTFEPTPAQISKLSSARAYFKVGMPFEERLVKKISALFPNLKIVDLNSGLKLREMEVSDYHESSPTENRSHHGGKSGKHKGHAHGKSSLKDSDSQASNHQHAHGSMDPHVWLNPANVKTISSKILDTLVSIDPERADIFKRNAQSFDQKIEDLDKYLAETFKGLDNKNFYVYHPAFGYLADRYGLRQKAVEIEGKEPSAKQLARLIDTARKEGVKVIFVAPQFSRKGAETVASGIGGAVLEIDPLARDYMGNMSKMADNIRSGLK